MELELRVPHVVLHDGRGCQGSECVEMRQRNASGEEVPEDLRPGGLRVLWRRRRPLLTSRPWSARSQRTRRRRWVHQWQVAIVSSLPTMLTAETSLAGVCEETVVYVNGTFERGFLHGPARVMFRDGSILIANFDRGRLDGPAAHFDQGRSQRYTGTYSLGHRHHFFIVFTQLQGDSR